MTLESELGHAVRRERVIGRAATMSIERVFIDGAFAFLELLRAEAVMRRPTDGCLRNSERKKEGVTHRQRNGTVPCDSKSQTDCPHNCKRRVDPATDRVSRSK